MRITKAFTHLLALQGLRVTHVDFHADALLIFVDVQARSRRLVCSRCHRPSRRGCYDSHPGRLWRHLDLGPWRVYLRGMSRRFLCDPCGAVVTAAVPWAAPGSTFTWDFEDVTSFLAQQASRLVVSRVMDIAWLTVGNIIRRTVARRGRPLRTRRLYAIGVDEISYRKHHKYLTIVADHLAGQVVWGGPGRSGKTLGAFFDEIGTEGRQQIQLVSIDMCQAYLSEIQKRLPHATVVFDPFHVVKLANDAVDKVRREHVRTLKARPTVAMALKKTRWILLKAPTNLRLDERERLSVLAQVNKPLYRAYLLKEGLRSIYDTDSPTVAGSRLKAWLAWASRARLAPFLKLARTLRQHQQGILAAIRHGLSNGLLEGLNSKIRLLSHRAFGFHSADALLALVHLCCSGVNIPLPQDQRKPWIDPYSI